MEYYIFCRETANGMDAKYIFALFQSAMDFYNFFVLPSSYIETNNLYIQFYIF